MNMEKKVRFQANPKYIIVGDDSTGKKSFKSKNFSQKKRILKSKGMKKVKQKKRFSVASPPQERVVVKKKGKKNKKGLVKRRKSTQPSISLNLERDGFERYASSNSNKKKSQKSFYSYNKRNVGSSYLENDDDSEENIRGIESIIKNRRFSLNAPNVNYMNNYGSENKPKNGKIDHQFNGIDNIEQEEKKSNGHEKIIENEINSKILIKKKEVLTKLLEIRQKIDQLEKRKEYVVNETNEFFGEIIRKLEIEKNRKEYDFLNKIRENKALLEQINRFLSRVRNESLSGELITNQNDFFLEMDTIISKKVHFVSEKESNFKREVKELDNSKRENIALKKTIKERDEEIKKLELELREERAKKKSEIERITKLYFGVKEELTKWINLHNSSV